MGKTSTNAGIHPYLKPDFVSPVKISESQGIPLPKETPKFMDAVINTEYKDSQKKDLYFKDEVEYEGQPFEIGYDPRNFRWVIKSEKRTYALKEVSKKVILTKKCSARI